MISGKACAEVIYIINKMPNNMKLKIPIDLLEAINKKVDQNYYNNIKNLELEKFKMSDQAEKVLSVLYTDYIAEKEEKMIIEAKEKSLNLNKEKCIKK